MLVGARHGGGTSRVKAWFANGFSGDRRTAGVPEIGDRAVLSRRLARDAAGCIDHYNKGDGLQDPYLDEDIQHLSLTETEIGALVAFLASRTSAQYREQGARELARQPEIARTNRPQCDTARAFGPKPPRPKPPGP